MLSFAYVIVCGIFSWTLVVVFFVLYGERWEVVVRFIDVGRIVDLQIVNVLFIILFITRAREILSSALTTVVFIFK